MTIGALEGFVMTGKAVVGITETPLILELRRADGGRSTLSAAGPIDEVYTLTLAFLLVSEVGSRLRRCADPKCSRFFLREHKMEYCSKRCARR